MSIKQSIKKALSSATRSKNDEARKDFESLHFLMTQIDVGLSRAAYARGLRNIDPTNPLSWEYAGFSQNGEDGIIEYILNNVKDPNYYFVEIGASDGAENNSSLLAFGKRYAGLMVEGDIHKSNLCARLIDRLSIPYISCLNLFMNLQNVSSLMQKIAYTDPDFFSLDIDGNDFHICKYLLENSFRPKLIVVEYNASFGDEISVTIPYAENFEWGAKHNQFYFGSSITAWRKLLEKYDYCFVTVESAGSNAFFIDKDKFHSFLPENFHCVDFIDNKACLVRLKQAWQERFIEIGNADLIEI
jgi:hypothetical protein